MDVYERIVEACQAAGNPKPKIRCEADGIWIEFAFPEEYRARAHGGEHEETPRKGSPKGSPKSSPKTDERIIELIAADSTISTERVGELLGISKRAVLKQTRKLQDQKRLKHVGPAKGGHWQVLEREAG